MLILDLWSFQWVLLWVVSDSSLSWDLRKLGEKNLGPFFDFRNDQYRLHQFMAPEIDSQNFWGPRLRHSSTWWTRFLFTPDPQRDWNRYGQLVLYFVLCKKNENKCKLWAQNTRPYAIQTGPGTPPLKHSKSYNSLSNLLDRLLPCVEKTREH